MELSEEEKKAIKYLKNEIERINKENDFKKIPRDIVCLPLFIDYAETLLNLIEKLKKENEEYKLLNANIEKANRIIEGKEKYISKDKIKEKVDKLYDKIHVLDPHSSMTEIREEFMQEGAIDVLEELLEDE